MLNLVGVNNVRSPYLRLDSVVSLSLFVLCSYVCIHMFYTISPTFFFTIYKRSPYHTQHPVCCECRSCNLFSNLYIFLYYDTQVFFSFIACIFLFPIVYAIIMLLYPKCMTSHLISFNVICQLSAQLCRVAML